MAKAVSKAVADECKRHVHRDYFFSLNFYFDFDLINLIPRTHFQ